ncbi:SsgA family sporulation/cell division regulator [Streptosporangium canum]|uniref:SsgA family sporulation/cell division regulator n=1 Tax=Streptosporangium canum TaxID=324952 RepID=UPI0037B4912E
MSQETAAVNERGLYVPLRDYATDEFHNGWLIYRPADDPYFVRIQIDGSAVPLDVPRAVLQQGLDRDAVCMELWACPSADAGWVLWTVQCGGLQRRTFRVPRTLVAKHLTALYELVPLGQEGDRIDWDGALTVLLGGAS